MTKFLRLSIDAEVVSYGRQRTFRVVVKPDAVPQWCLALCLLKRRLVDSVTIIAHPSGVKLRVRMLDADSFSRVSALPNQEPGHDVALIETDLDHVLGFFLKYYRDGVAEVDHIDVQCSFDIHDEGDSYLTFVAPEFLPPVTPEEAAKRLGLA